MVRSGCTPWQANSFTRSTNMRKPSRRPGRPPSNRETVAQHHVPSRQRGRDDLRHQLRAGGLVDEQLGLVGHAVRRVHDHGAQLLAHLGAAARAGTAPRGRAPAASRTKADMRRLAGAPPPSNVMKSAQGIGCLCGFVYHGYGRLFPLKASRRGTHRGPVTIDDEDETTSMRRRPRPQIVVRHRLHDATSPVGRGPAACHE